MRSVTFSFAMSLDGFIAGPDGSFDWGATEPEVFRHTIEEVRELGAHLLGRRIHEAMRYWETVDPDTLDDDKREFADLWNSLRKIVFSTTLSEVEGTATLATAGLADEIARLKAEPGEGNIAVAGATLAAAVARLGLIDEYRIRVYPVLVGGGIPFFGRDGGRVDLELLDVRALSGRIAFHHYRVKRPASSAAA